MPARRPVRRSQLITPFGVGAMVDFPRDESLIIAGLDAWPFATAGCPPESDWLVKEERLQARLGVTHFRLPPAYEEGAPGVEFARIGVPVLRFPRWHYCPHCGGMEFLSMFGSMQPCNGPAWSEGQTCATRPPKRRPVLIPMRFVAVCSDAHIQDFPFMEWVHRDPEKPPRPDCRLRARAGRSSAGLSGMMIECTCKQRRTMSNAFDFDPNQGGALTRINCRCLALRPWLGEYQADRLADRVVRSARAAGGVIEEIVASTCDKHLRVVQRGASNVYFPQVFSSIYLPLWGERLSSRPVTRALEDARVWQFLSGGLENGRISRFRCEAIAELRGLDIDELLEAAQRKLDGRLPASEVRRQTEEQYRQTEYEALRDGRGAEEVDLLVKPGQLENYDDLVRKIFSRICLVHKLRETRALAGFTRLLPPDGNLDDPRLQPLKGKYTH